VARREEGKVSRKFAADEIVVLGHDVHACLAGLIHDASEE